MKSVTGYDRWGRTEAVGTGRRAPGVPGLAPRGEAILRLQRSAGNRAVGRLLSAGRLQGSPRRAIQRDKGKPPKPGISVHKGSKLSADELLAKLKGNRKVPEWLKKGLASTAGSIVMSGEPKPPEGRIWVFVDTFAEAFRSGQWEITTAKSKIEVKQGADRQRSWSQIVAPDLSADEHIGTWMKTGRDQKEFSATTLRSGDAEVIYGWTEPDAATNLRTEKRGLIVIVTEIEVTTPDGKKKVFKPGPDEIAEAMLHEISVHAGRISRGLADLHSDTDAAVKDVVDQVGGFFRPSNSQDELEPSPLTRQIFEFAREPSAGSAKPEGARKLARDPKPEQGSGPQIVTIAGESVRVASAAEKRDAERIINGLQEAFGVDISSSAALRAIHARYKRDDVGAEQYDATKVVPWEYKELQGVERALKHFAPILGGQRKKSTRKSSSQEVIHFGKLSGAPDDDPKHPESATRGEYFDADKTAALFTPDADLSEADPLYFERHATHEIAHGVFAPQLKEFMAATRFWSEERVRVPKKDRKAHGSEEPPDSRASENAREDLAQSVMYFFVDRELLKKGGKTAAGQPVNACPKRFAFIKKAVGDWTAS